MTRKTGDVARPLLTVAEVAARLALSEKTVYRMIELRELPSALIGKHTIRVRPEDLEAYLERTYRAGA